MERQVQIARNLTPEAMEIIQASDAKLTKQDALKLSRLEPGRQKDAANRLASGEIRSMKEYQSAEPEIPLAMTISPKSTGNILCTQEDKTQNNLKKIVADLKSHDKDSAYTPDSLLGDIDGMADRFHRDFAWYNEPHCVSVFSQLSQAQFEFVKLRFASISIAMEDLLHQMERNMQHE